MSATAYTLHSLAVDAVEAGDAISAQLYDTGLVIVEQALPMELITSLAVLAKQRQSQFQAAGIGRGQQHHQNLSVRGDHIQWLDADVPPLVAYFDGMEQLRQSINRHLTLGLFDYECHFAHYPPGAFYKTHRDAFAGQASRRLSTILYLNDNWQAEEGGELVVYADEPSVAESHPTELIRVLPQAGRLVLFLSERFPHEVLPATRARYSLTGWFRVNPL